jgi:general secretion pathway protein K
MLVLWVVALLTIIAVGLTAAQRTESLLASNQLEASRFRALAQAGVSYALLNLLAPPPLVQDEELEVWAPDGSPRYWSFAGETLDIRVFNEASRIDLNKAPRELFVELFRVAGVPQDQVDALADAILDWRDENDLHLVNGAEDGDYEAAGLAYGAKDGPFDSVEELQQVLGFDRALYAFLAPALTVDAERARVDAEFAQPLVRAALEGITLEEAELEQQEREAEDEAGVPGARPLGRGGPLYRIRVTRVLQGEPGLSMEAMVLVEARGEVPFRVLWRRYRLFAQAPHPEEGY